MDVDEPDTRDTWDKQCHGSGTTSTNLHTALCEDTGCNPEDLPEARVIGRDGERRSGISAQTARHDDVNNIFRNISFLSCFQTKNRNLNRMSSNACPIRVEIKQGIDEEIVGIKRTIFVHVSPGLLGRLLCWGVLNVNLDGETKR